MERALKAACASELLAHMLQHEAILTHRAAHHLFIAPHLLRGVLQGPAAA